MGYFASTKAPRRRTIPEIATAKVGVATPACGSPGVVAVGVAPVVGRGVTDDFGVVVGVGAPPMGGAVGLLLGLDDGVAEELGEADADGELDAVGEGELVGEGLGDSSTPMVNATASHETISFVSVAPGVLSGTFGATAVCLKL